jgi:hypothetical protein
MKLKCLLASSGALVLATSAASSLVACGPVTKRDTNHQTKNQSFTYESQKRNLAEISDPATIEKMANQEAQILLLASQFGLGRDELAKIIGFDTKGFVDNFDLSSLEALTKDSRFHQTLGQKGALLTLVTGKDYFEIDNPLATKIFKGALGKRHVTGTSYSSQELAKTVEYFLDLIYPFIKNANLAQAIKGLTGLVNFTELSTEDIGELQRMA